MEGVVASGFGSFAHGTGVEAVGLDQFVIGSNNVKDSVQYAQDKGTYAFIIGNGDIQNNTRSNAFAVKWDGGVVVNSGANYLIQDSSIAPVEASTTASKAYSVGDLLMLGGQLYKVTTNIASGGTINTSGGSQNVSATTIAEYISDSISAILNASY